MTQRILFVCLGNICRSPAAEGVFRTIAPEVASDSAATSGMHAGNAPYGPMKEAMAARGIDISDLRARQIEAADFGRFDRILVMDEDNLEDVEAIRPPGSGTPVQMFTSFLNDPNFPRVPDPYYTRDFDGCLDLIEDAASALKQALLGPAE